jgi:hypothetical protein
MEVGACEGDTVGDPVGVEVGAAVGVAVGAVVGAFVGPFVGGPVGAAVGLFVGRCVGGDGTAVGAIVGAFVVGAVVGASVEAKVGDGVGVALEPPSRRPLSRACLNNRSACVGCSEKADTNSKYCANAKSALPGGAWDATTFVVEKEEEPITTWPSAAASKCSSLVAADAVENRLHPGGVLSVNDGKWVLGNGDTA